MFKSIKLKFLTRGLLLMISKSHISFKAITFSTVYITKFKLFKIQNENGKKSLRKLLRFSFYPFSLQIRANV